MKQATILTLLLAFTTLSACGSEERANDDEGSSSLAAAPAAIIHKIQPLNVNSQCFGSYERIIRDHRTTPTRTYSEYMLGMKGCSAPESSLVIQMLGGQQWTGGFSFVTIKKNGLCLTNPVSYATSGVDKGETFWRACVAQNSGSPERFRQQWLLTFNRYNAMQIQTQAAVKLGFPNAQAQCIERQDPTTVKRVSCQLNNWQVVTAN
jgi:hypothetical protein